MTATATPTKHGSVRITYEGEGVVATCSCGWLRYSDVPTRAAGLAMWNRHRPKHPPQETPTP